MNACSVCGYGIERSPDSLGDWFRCEICRTPLRAKSGYSIATRVISVSAAILVVVTSLDFLAKLKLAIDLEIDLVVIILAVEAWLARFLWRLHSAKLEEVHPLEDPFNLHSFATLRSNEKTFKEPH